MMTVKEIAGRSHCSVRTLHHYDAIGLLKPTTVTEAGYRLYDDDALERLYLILLFRELGFPLKKIQGILDAPDYDRNRILEQQAQLLKAKVTHLQNRIHLVNGIKLMGVKYLEFDNWDPKKIDEYQAQAENLYGKTEAWQQWQRKRSRRSPGQEQQINSQVMDFFRRLGQLRHLSPDSKEVQCWVRELQEFFTEHFYDCTPQILRGLGEMYAGGGSMTENIDKTGGDGTGEFAKKAIDFYCANQ
ncbi:MAG: MerR family transcriptional regulator [Oscillospiraceae bacterium]|nr:MerR family transcriptional regulator [Oscillospiraceae bacterium]